MNHERTPYAIRTHQTPRLLKLKQVPNRACLGEQTEHILIAPQPGSEALSDIRVWLMSITRIQWQQADVGAARAQGIDPVLSAVLTSSNQNAQALRPVEGGEADQTLGVKGRLKRHPKARGCNRQARLQHAALATRANQRQTRPLRPSAAQGVAERFDRSGADRDHPIVARQQGIQALQRKRPNSGKWQCQHLMAARLECTRQPEHARQRLGQDKPSHLPAP